MINETVAVSVVIPIFNVEKYLEECLDSVINQTLKNIEIICINDGSTDNSGKIIDHYSQNDSRIKVIHKMNTGYGNSMNVGIQNATGKYVGIVEPDDFITEDMMQDLYTIAEREHTDIIKSDFAFLEGEKGNYQILPTKIYPDDRLYKRLLGKEERKVLFKGYIAHWTCLYNRSFLEKNHIMFNETPGASYQDTGFWFQTLMYAERFYLHDNFYYCYRCDNPNSSMLSKTKVHCISTEYDYIFDKMCENEAVFKEYLPIYVMCRFAGHRDTIDRIGDEYKLEFIRDVASDFNDLKARGILNVGYMNDEDVSILFEIMANPVQFYEKKMYFSKKLHILTASYKKLYIYGAGYMGKKIYKQLMKEDKEKIKGFLVTKKDGQTERVEGLNVYQWNEFGKVDSQTGIIVGVTKRYEDEIINLLKNAGILHPITFSE